MPINDTPKAKAVLFDMDGTLLDTLQDLADSGNAVLQGHDLPPHPQKAYQQFVGSGVRELMRRAMPADKRNDAELVAECIRDIRAEYSRRWDKKATVYPGMLELLAALGQRGVPLGVVTNKPQQFATLFADRFFPDKPFAIVLGPEDDTPTKPNPFMAMEAARTLGVSAADCVFMGDSNVDMQTADNAGMLPVGCLWGFRSEAELKENGARVLLGHPLELLEKVRLPD